MINSYQQTYYNYISVIDPYIYMWRRIHNFAELNSCCKLFLKQSRRKYSLDEKLIKIKPTKLNQYPWRASSGEGYVTPSDPHTGGPGVGEHGQVPLQANSSSSLIKRIQVYIMRFTQYTINTIKVCSNYRGFPRLNVSLNLKM